MQTTKVLLKYIDCVKCHVQLNCLATKGFHG